MEVKPISSTRINILVFCCDKIGVALNYKHDDISFIKIKLVAWNNHKKTQHQKYSGTYIWNQYNIYIIFTVWEVWQ